MSHTTKTCPGCGQALRIPEELGGVAMACPNCGQRIPSFFKLGASGGAHAPSRGAPLPALSPRLLVPGAAAHPTVEPSGDGEQTESPAHPAEAPLHRVSLLNASGVNRYKLMQREG